MEWDDNISEADFLDWLADQPNDNVEDENATDEAKLWFPRDSDVEPQLIDSKDGANMAAERTRSRWKAGTDVVSQIQTGCSRIQFSGRAN